MADFLTCGLELKQLTVYIIQICALMSIYMFGREVTEIYLYRRPDNFNMSEILLIATPLQQMLFSGLGYLAMKKNTRKLLLPLLSIKVSDSISFFAVLFGIPIACAVYGYDRVLYEFQRQFNTVPASPEHSTSWLVSSMITIFVSGLVFAVEEVNTFPRIVVGSIFFVYTIVLIGFQVLFAITLIRCYRQMNPNNAPSATSRFTVTQIEGSTTYQVICEGPETPATSPKGKTPEKKAHTPHFVDTPVNIN